MSALNIPIHPAPARGATADERIAIVDACLDYPARSPEIVIEPAMARPHGDPLSAARGLAVGLAISACLFAMLGMLIWTISAALEVEARETLRQQETLLGSSFRSATDRNAI